MPDSFSRSRYLQEELVWECSNSYPRGIVILNTLGLATFERTHALFNQIRSTNLIGIDQYQRWNLV